MYASYAKLIELVDDEVVFTPYGYYAIPICIHYSNVDGRTDKKTKQGTVLMSSVYALTMFSPKLIQALDGSVKTAIVNHAFNVYSRKSGEKTFAPKYAVMKAFKEGLDA